MPTSTVWQFDDPAQYSAHIRTMRTELVVTQAGQFSAKLIRIDLRRLSMQHLSERLSRVAHHEDTSGCANITFIARAGPAIFRDGSEERFGSLQRHSEGRISFQRTTGPAYLGSLAIALADMEAIGANLCDCDLTPPRESLSVTPTAVAMNRLRDLHATAGDLAEYLPGIIACPEAANGLEQAVIAVVAECLSTNHDRSSRSGNDRQGRTLTKFYEILEANQSTVFHVPEMCAHLGVSIRTLTTYSNAVLGMSPHRYLKLRQLHLARRALVLGDPETTTVTEIATAHGFWELGRFAVAYRTLFGERPSSTLRRTHDKPWTPIISQVGPPLQSPHTKKALLPLTA